MSIEGAWHTLGGFASRGDERGSGDNVIRVLTDLFRRFEEDQVLLLGLYVWRNVRDDEWGSLGQID
jgi:hypothetical protein